MEVLLKTFAMYNTQALTIADPRIKKTTQGAKTLFSGPTLSVHKLALLVFSRKSSKEFHVE